MRHVIYLLLVANALYFAWHLVERSSGDSARRVAVTLPPGVKSIETLREREERLAQEELASVAEIEKLVENEPPAAGPVTVCHTLGPFLTRKELADVRLALREQKLDVKERSSQAEEVIGYRLYLPAMERAAALQTARMLDRSKVGDYFIGQENLISLGVFAEKGRAEKHQETIRDLGLGLEPQIEPRFEVRNASWLDFVIADAASESLNEIIDKHQGIRLQIRICE